MPIYFRFPNPLQSIRAQAFAFWNGIPTFGAWYAGNAYQVSGSGIAEVATFSGTPSASAFGFIDTVNNAASGTLFTYFSPTLRNYTFANTTSTTPVPSSGAILNGAVRPSAAASGYATDVSGNIYSFTSSITNATFLGSFGGASRALAYNVTTPTLYTIASSGAAILTYTLSTSTSGSIASPITHLLTLATSGNYIAAGGWNPLYVSGSFSAIDLNPTNAALFAAVTSGSGIVSIYTTDAFGNATLAASAAVSGKPTFVEFTPLSNTIFACDPISGYVDVLTYITSVLTATQAIVISGATTLGITSDSLNALVCQHAQNALTAITFSGSTWQTSSSPLTLAAPNVALGLSATQIVVGYASGLAYYTLAAGAWTQTSSAATAYPVQALALDSSANLIYAGASGSSGFVATVAGSAAFSGSVNGMLWQQGQIAIGSASGNVVNVFADASYGVSFQKSYSGVAALASIAQSASGIFALTSGFTYELEFSAPYTLYSVQSGAVSLYNGSSWISTALNGGNVPHAVTFDSSGNITAATLQNNLFTIAASGGVSSSGAIAVFSGQSQNASLGISSLAWSGTTLYATSTQNESFIQVTP